MNISDTVEAHEPPPPTLSSLPDVLLLHTLSYLPPACLQRCRAVSAKWSSLGGDSHLWRAICSAEFGLHTLTSPAGATYVCYMAAASRWSHFRAELDLPNRPCEALAQLHLGAAVAWDKVADWANVHLPQAYATIQAGATPTAWASFLRHVGLDDCPALLPLRLLASVHDGQLIPIDLRTALQQFAGEEEDDDAEEAAIRQALEGLAARIPPTLPNSASGRWLGLCGGYSAYDEVASVRLFPLPLIAAWTHFFRKRAGLPRSWLVVAGSFNLRKAVFLNGDTGLLHVGPVGLTPPAGGHTVTPLGRANLNAMRAVPEALTDGSDLIAWFGALGAALQDGLYVAEPLVPLNPSTRGLCLFPRAPPKASNASARGVRIVASAVYCPEIGMFAYSIRIVLLAAGEAGHVPEAERGFGTAQLHSRRWVLTMADGTQEHVEGEGVVRPPRAAATLSSCRLTHADPHMAGGPLPAAARGRLERAGADCARHRLGAARPAGARVGEARSGH